MHGWLKWYLDSLKQSLFCPHILQPKHFTTLAIQYGIDNENLALEKYVSYQNTHGHPDLTVSAFGFLTSTSHPFLGASPHGAVCI